MLDAVKENIDFEDIEGTHVFFDIATKKTKKFSMHKWQKALKRGQCHPLPICSIMIGQSQNVFIKCFGHCTLSAGTGRFTRSSQGDLTPIPTLPNHQFCRVESWPKHTPATIFTAFQCPKCRLETFLSIGKHLSPSLTLAQGLQLLVRLALSMNTAQKMMKNERFSAKSPSFINALKIICERSQLFEEAINKEDLPTDEEAVAIIADLTDSLPLNDEEFSFNGL